MGCLNLRGRPRSTVAVFCRFWRLLSRLLYNAAPAYSSATTLCSARNLANRGRGTRPRTAQSACTIRSRDVASYYILSFFPGVCLPFSTEANITRALREPRRPGKESLRKEPAAHHFCTAAATSPAAAAATTTIPLLPLLRPIRLARRPRPSGGGGGGGGSGGGRSSRAVLENDARVGAGGAEVQRHRHQGEEPADSHDDSSRQVGPVVRRPEDYHERPRPCNCEERRAGRGTKRGGQRRAGD